MAPHDRPQAHRAPVPGQHHAHVLHRRGCSRCGIRLELLTPPGDLVQPETYNKLFTMHGVVMVFFFLIPSIPAVLGNFLMPIMIGAKDLAFPRLNLLSWYIYMVGAVLHALRAWSAAASTPAGRSTRRTAPRSRTPTWCAAGARHLHRRLLLDPDRPQLHRHDPQDARAGPDLVPPAALRVGALRDQHHPGAGHAGDRDHAPAGGRRARVPPRHLRPGAGRRPGALPAPLLVLLAPGRLHHDPARHGRDQRARHLLLAQAHLRLRVHRHVQPWRSRCSASWSGATTCSSPASRPTRAWSSRSSVVPGRDPVGDQGLQLDGHALQGLDLAATRRCSTRSASSASSRSAG